MSIIRLNNKSEIIIIIFKNFSLTHICFIITCQVMTNDLAKDMRYVVSIEFKKKRHVLTKKLNSSPVQV